jgi:hypothetical protein
MLLLIIILLLLFGGGGGYYGYSRWGAGGGLGIVGTVVLIAVVVHLLGGLRCLVSADLKSTEPYLKMLLAPPRDAMAKAAQVNHNGYDQN